jgi:hypothetical protein
MAEETNDAELQLLSEADWKRLIEKIKSGHCTPIIGPGAYSKTLPWNPRLATRWVEEFPEYPYPWDGSYELGRVAQFVSVVAPDPLVPKDAWVKQIRELEPPDFNMPDEPHRVLASLPLPIYITTNYDRFMVQAIEKRREGDKIPVREFCHWKQYMREYETTNLEDPSPTVANPIVYHLHGHEGFPDSLVLTYDDYLDFLVNVSEENALIPPRIQRALAGNSLLLLGYQLEDWNFRVLFRAIVLFLQKGTQRTHVAVQFDPSFGDKATEEQIKRAQKYFNRYFEKINVKVYWGTCQKFVTELRERLNSPLLKAVDIKDWQLLCLRLTKAVAETSPNPSKKIFDLLPADLRQIISEAAQANNFGLAHEANFVPAFNNILRRRDFYEPAVFAGVAITAEARTFLERKAELSDREVQRLNRLLFEASYPEEIEKNNEWEAF